MTPLTEKIAEVVEICLSSPEGTAGWRGIIAGEEWKILASYNGRERESLQIVVKRRDRV